MEILLVVVGIILDRITKIWAVKKLSSGEEIEFIKNFFSFKYLENRGAAFGIFQGKTVLLVIFTIIAVSAITYYVLRYKPNSKIVKIGFACVIAGAIGNLYDRVAYKFVVDFILIHYKDVYYYPTFNIADILVVLGTIMIGIFILKEEKQCV